MSGVNFPSNSSNLSEDNCSICHESLLITSGAPSEDSSGPSTFIDDILLRCGHHFHWSCIIDYGVSTPSVRPRCPSCGDNILNDQGRLIVDVRNEGGLTEGFDLGSEIEEELYCTANPEIRRKGRFFSLINQGDYAEAEFFLKGESEDANDEKMDPNIRYEEGDMTALHMAALSDDVECVQMLLRHGADKSLKTSKGDTALDLAVSNGASGVVAILS